MEPSQETDRAWRRKPGGGTIFAGIGILLLVLAFLSPGDAYAEFPQSIDGIPISDPYIRDCLLAVADRIQSHQISDYEGAQQIQACADLAKLRKRMDGK